MQLRIAALALSLAALFLASAPAQAELHVTVDQANIQPMPIAIPDFTAGPGTDPAMGHNIASVVRADLERSGLFRPIDPKAYIDKITDINTTPNFADWRVINAQALVAGGVWLQDNDGQVHAGFRLWDIYGQAEMHNQAWKTQPDSWRRIAHKISDAIYERITGEKGYFDTRIVFISESGRR